MLRFSPKPVLRWSVTVGAFSAALLGGCPVAQTPNQAATNSNANSSSTSNSGTDTGNAERPVVQAPVDTTSSSSGGGSGGGSSGSGGNSGSGTGAGTVFVSVTAPTNNIRVRPGAIVGVSFDVNNSSGALNRTELVVAFDANNDGKPDGDPIAERTKTISASSGLNSLGYDTNELVGNLTSGFGRFLLGIRTTTVSNEVKVVYALGNLTLDDAAPVAAWVTPTDNQLLDRNQTWTVTVNTSDNAPHTVKILLDPDDQEMSGNELEFQAETAFPVGAADRTFTKDLSLFPSGTYRYYVIVSDGIAPANAFYATSAQAGGDIQITTTNRIIGNVDLATLANPPANKPSPGAIFTGFNFNDLAGSSIASVGDLNADGRPELIIGSRYGKAYIIQNNGVGYGEAYLIYGSAQRVRGITRLNQVGTASTPGLVFPGIRTPLTASTAPPNQSTRWTKGLSDIAVIPDMDGDGRPEIAFAFPRVESVNVGETNPTIQHPELAPDLGGMGNLEYNAFYGLPPTWHANESQFTRGGVVIVSSHNEMLRNPALLSRKASRVFDLHETGQLFTGMTRPALQAYIRQAVPRNLLDGLGRAAPFEICADCDFDVPAGFDPGTPAVVNGNVDGTPNGYPNNPNDPQDTPATPGECGDDGCFNPANPADPYLGNRHDGREARIQRWFLKWDATFVNQGPGGFGQPWSVPPVNPPLAGPSAFPWGVTLPFPPSGSNVWYPNFCGTACEITHEWFSYASLPCTSLGGTSSWDVAGNPRQRPTDCYANNPSGGPPGPPFLVPPLMPCDAPPPLLCPPPAVNVSVSGTAAWTGFGGPASLAYVSTTTGETFPTPIGARILGQKVDDEFGTSLASDGTWLYISSPSRTANDAPYNLDVPSLPGTRNDAGIVYQLRTDARLTPGETTRTQLWLERGTREIPGPNPGDPPQIVQLTWPNVDAEDVNRTDYTMPVPHNYIIETIGSLRGNPEIGRVDSAFGVDATTCPPGFDPAGTFDGSTQDDTDQPRATACTAYTPYPVGTAGYYMGNTPQIVGPHASAKISAVQALGDVNDDGIADFAVSSENVKQDVFNPSSPVVGAVFIVYGRPPGLEGDYLLEKMALVPTSPERIEGVLLKGDPATGGRLARTIADAGDVDNDGISDVIIGYESANGNQGEAIILFGSPSLLSPAGGWTVSEAVASGNAIRIVGEAANDFCGANVAGAGDVDHDGFADVLIAAPGANGGKGAVYLIYGSDTFRGPTRALINLSAIGTFNLPGARFVGRVAGDALGAGSKSTPNTDPAGNPTLAYSRGMTHLGDLDGDGFDDFAISAMLASPFGRVNSGEVFVLYGRGD